MTVQEQLSCIGVSMLAALGATLVIFAISKASPVIYEKIKSGKDSIKRRLEKRKVKNESLQSKPIPESPDSFEINVIPSEVNEVEFFQIMTPVYIGIPVAASDKVGNLQTLPPVTEDKNWKKNESKAKKSQVTFKPLLKKQNPEDSSVSKSNRIDEKERSNPSRMKTTYLHNQKSSSMDESSPSSSMDESSSSSSMGESSSDTEGNDQKNPGTEKVEKLEASEDRNVKAKKVTFKPLLKGQNPDDSSESESEKVVRQRSSRSSKTKAIKSKNIDSNNSSSGLEGKPLVKELKSNSSQPSKKTKQSKKRKSSVKKSVRQAGKPNNKGNVSKKTTKKSKKMIVDPIQNIASSSKDSKVEIKANVKKDANDSLSNQKDVEAIVTVENHPGNENMLDIDLDLFVDPKTKKAMKVHTHAEVDKPKMNLRGKAEAKEGEGKAKISGLISHKGQKDIGTIELDVIEESQDSDEIEIEAKSVKEEKEDMK